MIEQFTRSFEVDRWLFREDIAGGRAWAKALVGAGVLTAEEQLRIDIALREIGTEFEKELAAGEGRVAAAEDIHMAVEKRLQEKLGPLGGKLHTGRSRNDQVAVDLRLFVRAAGGRLLEAIASLASALVARAEEHIDTVMPGYTHTQRAQPVLLAHHLLAYVEMLRRDHGRIADALDRGIGQDAVRGTRIDLVNAFAFERFHKDVAPEHRGADFGAGACGRFRLPRRSRGFFFSSCFAHTIF